MIRDLADVATVRPKRGEELRVKVADNGNGPAVSVSKFVTESEYDQAPAYMQAKSRAKELRRPLSTYTGPTKGGLWLTINQALELAEAIVAAAIRAEELGGDPDGMPEHLREGVSA